jgi:leucyl aminopeptidase (aminopeptidase T)
MGNRFDELRPAAVNMMRSNMGLKDGESVLFMVDVPMPADYALPFNHVEEMLDRALMTRKIYDLMKVEFPRCRMDFMAFPSTGQSGKEPPAETAARMLEYDVAIIMTTHSLSHTNAREHATKKGVRIASMPGIEASMFLPGGPMDADYSMVEKESTLWAERQTAGRDVHITTPFGTDLRFSIADREGFPDCGILHKKGDWGNLPAGEAAAPPMEGTANGKLVVPAGWYPDLAENMTLTFKDGYVISVEGGGPVGREFVETFHFGDDTYKHRRNCAELGIGTNPNAKRTDSVLEAEKIKGTVHVAVGDNIHMGGRTESDLHTDFILCQPTLVIDSQRLIG